MRARLQKEKKIGAYKIFKFLQTPNFFVFVVVRTGPKIKSILST